MKLSTNIMCFQQHLGLEKTLQIFSDAGFEAVEFNSDIEEYYTDTHDKEYYKNIKKLCDDLGIEITQAHAHFRFGNDMADSEKAKKHFKGVIKGIENSSYLGAKMIIVHPVTHLNLDIEKNDEKLFEYNIKYYRTLIPYAEQYNIKIAIENISKSITEKPEELLKLIKTLNNDVFTVCCDVGHTNMCGQVPADTIKRIGKYIECTHIHDNDGIHDSHTLPYYGTIDWESVMKAFAETGYDGNLNYEAGMFVKNAPVCLRGESAKYMAEVGKHLIERFSYYKNAIRGE